MATSPYSSIRKITWLALGLLFLASRLLGGEKLPLFSDEAYAILRAEELHNGAPLLGMVRQTTQPIFIWFISLFQFFPIPIIYSSRLGSTIFGLGSATLMALIAKRLIHPSAATIAFLIVLFLPFSQFYDRTVLFESTALFWIIASFFIPVLSAPLALLTKATGLFALPLVIGIWWRKKRVMLASVTSAVLIPLVVWIVAVGGFDNLSVLLVKTGKPLSSTVSVKDNILRAKLWLTDYVTEPIVLLCFVGIVGILFSPLLRKKRQPLVVVFLWTGGVFLVEVFTARIFYPRYLYPMVLGIVLSATTGIWLVEQQLRKLFSRGHLWISICILIVATLYPSFRFMTSLIASPAEAPLPREDRFQFFEDWTSGLGSNELRNIISSRFPNGAIVYLEEENSYFITLRENSALSLEVAPWLWDPLEKIPVTVMQQPGEVLFVRNRYPDIPDNWPVELVAEIPKTNTRSVFLYRILKP